MNIFSKIFNYRADKAAHEILAELSGPLFKCDAAKIMALLDGFEGNKNTLLDTRDAQGRTALMLASHRGLEDIVAKLIERGANVNLADNAGDTALIHAAQGKSVGSAEMLIRNKADIAVALIKGYADIRQEKLKPGTTITEHKFIDLVEAMKNRPSPPSAPKLQ